MIANKDLPVLSMLLKGMRNIPGFPPLEFLNLIEFKNVVTKKSEEYGEAYDKFMESYKVEKITLKGRSWFDWNDHPKSEEVTKNLAILNDADSKIKFKVNLTPEQVVQMNPELEMEKISFLIDKLKK